MDFLKSDLKFYFLSGMIENLRINFKVISNVRKPLKQTWHVHFQGFNFHLEIDHINVLIYILIYNVDINWSKLLCYCNGTEETNRVGLKTFFTFWTFVHRFLYRHFTVGKKGKIRERVCCDVARAFNTILYPLSV